MKEWTSRDELTYAAVTLASQGVSARAIARAVGVSRNTVRKILEAHRRGRADAAPDALARPRSRAPRATKLDAFQEQIDALLGRYPDVTAQRIFEDLVDAGYEGGYTAVKERVRTLRPAAPPEPSRPTPEYGPGEMAENDWSPYSIAFTHAPAATVQVFAYVLTHCRRKYFGVYERSDLYALMDGHVAAFDRFGGAAQRCKYDGQKAVVLGWEGKQPLYNPRFLAFAGHYEFRPYACRPYHPNDKPRVERAHWEFHESFLNGRSFRDLADMRAQLRVWMDQTADRRPLRRGPKRSRLELFAEEQPHLVPLPRHPYDTARVVYRLCSLDGFVSWDGNRYAVPYEHITDLLPVRITQHELYVYAADLTRIARHELAPRGANVDLDPAGYHPRARPDGRAAADLDQLRQAYGGMGEDAAAFLTALCTAQPRQAAYHARRILLLRERFTTADLCGALRHAQAFGAWEHQAVERILGARCAPRSLAEYVCDDLARRLENGLGATEGEPRDLEEYDRLPLAAHPATHGKEDS